MWWMFFTHLLQYSKVALLEERKISDDILLQSLKITEKQRTLFFVSLFEISQDHLTDSEAVCFRMVCLF